MTPTQETIGIRNRVRELVAETQSAERKMKKAQQELNAIQTSCQHDWFPLQYDPIVRLGYHDPGDGDNWHGADKRFAQYVPEQRTDRWTRECRTCGLVQHTTRTNEEVKKVPVF